MKKFERNVIELIRSAIDEPYEAAVEIDDINRILDFAARQQIFSLLFAVLSNRKEFEELKSNEDFSKLFFYLFQLDLRQTCELKRLCTAFEDKGIDYMPLKGSILKNLYPSTDKRTMGDIDVLIRGEDREKIFETMKELGYEFTKESDHEIVFKISNVVVELHKRLIPSYNYDFDRYYSDSWKFAKIKRGHEYAMTDEDFFVYIFTHFAKHYRDKGAGIKYVVDFYVYTKSRNNLDNEYIEAQLTKLGIEKFYRNVKELIGVWFKGEKDSEMSDFLTRRIFMSGVYGTNANGKVSNLVKTKKRTRFYKAAIFFGVAFPKVETMKLLYPVLNKHIWLLPLFYLIRVGEKIIHPVRTIRAIKNVKEATNVSPERIEEYDKELEYVGLKYDF
ncbi:MAG: nucleotidyltransferase family protein [Clostridia bacterium]|nr:nucleotidyltransferase family protein [Clostridia bacterium]